jgi:hypothetical protein
VPFDAQLLKQPVVGGGCLCEESTRISGRVCRYGITNRCRARTFVVPSTTSESAYFTFDLPVQPRGIRTCLTVRLLRIHETVEPTRPCGSVAEYRPVKTSGAGAG